METCHASIAILESSVKVSRDIPQVLIGKVHWIDWSLFCDRLDEALKPLRSPKASFWRLRRRPLKAKVLKNIQKVCEKEVQKQPILHDFILYCPSASRKSLSVTNWHIQVVVNDSSTTTPPSVMDVPTCISFPTNTNTSSTPASDQSTPMNTFHQSLSRWPDLDGTVETAFSSAPMELPPPSPAYRHQHQHQHNHNRRDLGSSSSISSHDDDNNSLGNPFAAENNHDPAVVMSRDALLALDHQNARDNHFWMSAPTMGGSYHVDTMPIPMPPPAPYTKSPA